MHKIKIRVYKHSAKESHQIIREENRRREEQIRSRKQPECNETPASTSMCALSLTLCDPMDCGPFPRQKYGKGLLFPTPGDLPGPGIEPMYLLSPALAGHFFTTAPLGKP